MAAFSASAVAGYNIIPTAHAQAPKSIYDEQDSETIAPAPGTVAPAKPIVKEHRYTKTEIVDGVTVRTNETLEKTIQTGRTWLNENVEKGQEKVDSVFESYLAAEKSATSTIAAIKEDDEDLMPGAVYVLISALSGSIAVRNRNILLRGVAPVVFGAAAFKYFLPQAYENTGKLIWRFEQKAPALANAHTQAQDQVNGLVNNVSTAISDSKHAVESGVQTARKFVADTTGLQISSEKPKKD